MISKTLGLTIGLAMTLLTTPARAIEQNLPAGVLTTELKDGAFKASLKEGYHFNEKAPNSLTLNGKAIKPTQVQGRSAEFKDLPKDWSSGHASLYVCDDALTFCLPNRIDLKGAGDAKTGAITVSSARRSANFGKINSHGFIENDYKQALGKLKGKKQLLIDFSAIWCPGCVRLEREIFETRKFKDLSHDFVKLKIDVDAFENRVLLEKYGIKGIPALLLVNADQDEIGRLVDFQPLETVEGFFRSVKNDPTPLKKLNGDVKDPNAAYVMGKRLLTAGRYQESIPFFARIQPPPPELLAAKVASAETQFGKQPETKSAFAQVLKGAIQKEPASSRSINWRTQLVELIDDKTEIAKLRTDGTKLADTLLADPEKLKEATKTDDVGEFAGYEGILVATYSASLSEASGAPVTETEEAWKKAVEVGQKLKITPEKSGPALRYLIVLSSAKVLKEADELALKLIQKDPKDTDIQRRRIKILTGLGKFDEAIQVGQKCLTTSSGQNEFWTAEALAKAYVAANRKAEAKTLIDKYLAREEIGWPHLKQSKAGLEKLREGVMGAFTRSD
jgi:thioredoxin-like negative regulator of GroEL